MFARQRRRSAAARQIRSVVPFFALLVACAPEGDVLVEVVGAPSLAVDRLSVESYGGAAPGPVERRSLGPADGLPQRFLVRVGDETRAAGMFRLAVHGYHEDVMVASGDARIEADQSSATVTLTDGCRRVACPALQRCDPERSACDAACEDATDCAELLGCAPDAACGGATDGAFGVCSGAGADDDEDGERDARCPLGPSNLDCDDTDVSAGPGGTRRCGSLRDHDCDGLLDELQLCQGCAGADLFVGASDFVPLGAPVRAVAGPRPALDGHVAFAATSTEIVLVALSADGTVDIVAREPADDTRDLFLVGPLLAAATRDGLALFEVGAAPASLRRLGAPLPVPPTEPTALASVTVARGTAWVSGDGVALAAIDVRHPDNPRFLGMQRGPVASLLAPFHGGVIANAAAPGASGLRLFSAVPSEAPGAPVDVPFLTGSGEPEPVTALVARAPRPSVPDEAGVVVLAAAGGRVGALDRAPGGAFRMRDELSTPAVPAAIWLDDSLAAVLLSDGRLVIAPRGSEPGAFGAPTFEGALPGVGAVTDAGFSTGTGNAPRMVIGTGDGLVWVELRCAG